MLCGSCGSENPASASICQSCGAEASILTSASLPGDADGAGQLEPRQPVSAHENALTGSLFVGRRREIAELTSILRSVLSGRGALTMLTGEPGIGKTRTAEELASIAERLGCKILFSRSYEDQGAPPYWPWVQPIKACLQEGYADHVISAMGRGAAFIAEIVPELREQIPNIDTIPSLDSEQARFRLFDSVTTFFKSMAQRQPLVLVMDDIHLADRSSLLLLEFMGREIAHSPILVVGTYRDSEVTSRHPLSYSLGNLTREGNFRRARLTGLTSLDVRDYILHMAGEEPSGSLVDAIHSRTEGNPLYLREFVRLILQEGLQEDQVWTVSLPEGVRDIIGRRLFRLSNDCNRVLTVASLLGKAFKVGVLELLLVDEVSEERLLDALDEASDAGIITEIPSSPEEYQFNHALIREVLMAEMHSARQARLHARIGGTLENLSESGDDISAAEVAYHFAKAESLVGPAKVAHFASLAGEQALAAYSYEVALDHFNNALAAKEKHLRRSGSLSAHNAPDRAIDDECAAILYGLGHAQAALYQLEEAVASLTLAFDYYEKTNDVQRAMAIAGYSHSVPFVLLIGSLITRAMEMVPPDSLQAGGVFANYGFLVGMSSDDFQYAYDLLDKGLSIAHREEDPVLEVRILATMAEVLGVHLRWQESANVGFTAIEMANTKFDDTLARLRAHVWISNSTNVLGQPAVSAYHANEAIELATATRDRFWQGISLVLLAAISFDTGDWEKALALTERGLAVAPDEVFLLSLRTALKYEMGDFEEGSVLLRRILEEIQKVNPSSMSVDAGVLAIGVVYRLTNGRISGSDVAETVGRRRLESGRLSPYYGLFVQVGLSLIAVQKRDQENAGTLYSALKHRGGIPSLSGEVNLDRVLGLLAWTLGQPDEAAGHFEAALEFGRASGYLPQLAWSCCDYAEFLLENGDVGDKERIISLLDEASGTAEELRMKPLQERVRSNKGKAESLPDQDGEYPDKLTPREAEILSLVAAGMSNRQIAEKLIISLYTVNRHVSNIFAKTGVSNRSQATTYFMRHNLLGGKSDNKAF